MSDSCNPYLIANWCRSQQPLELCCDCSTVALLPLELLASTLRLLTLLSVGLHTMLWSKFQQSFA